MSGSAPQSYKMPAREASRKIYAVLKQNGGHKDANRGDTARARRSIRKTEPRKTGAAESDPCRRVSTHDTMRTVQSQ